MDKGNQPIAGFAQVAATVPLLRPPSSIAGFHQGDQTHRLPGRSRHWRAAEARSRSSGAPSSPWIDMARWQALGWRLRAGPHYINGSGEHLERIFV
jgi:hypothetical protein